MSDPCKQEHMVSAIESRQIVMTQKLDRVAETLETLAAQRVEITHLHNTCGERLKWLKNHEERIQTLERAPGALSGRLLWLLLVGIVTIPPTVLAALVTTWLKGTT